MSGYIYIPCIGETLMGGDITSAMCTCENEHSKSNDRCHANMQVQDYLDETQQAIFELSCSIGTAMDDLKSMTDENYEYDGEELRKNDIEDLYLYIRTSETIMEKMIRQENRLKIWLGVK